MITNFVEKLFSKNRAPEWFCRDIKNRVPEVRIKEKIRSEIHNEIAIKGYDTFLWTEDLSVG